MGFRYKAWVDQFWPSGRLSWCGWRPRESPGCVVLFFVMVVGLFITPWGRSVLQNIVSPESAKVHRAVADIGRIEAAVLQFREDCGRYPTSEEGLDALINAPRNASRWKGPYLVDSPGKDPWGSEYGYESPHNGKDTFQIESYGADGVPGGRGVDADIKDIGDGPKTFN